MRRACVILASACLLLSVGCHDYDNRLEKTLAEMKYQQKLERNLEKAPAKGQASAGTDLHPPAQRVSPVRLRPLD